MTGYSNSTEKTDTFSASVDKNSICDSLKSIPLNYKEQQQKVEEIKALLNSLKQEAQNFYREKRQEAIKLKQQIQQHEQYLAFIEQCRELKLAIDVGITTLKKKARQAGTILHDNLEELGEQVKKTSSVQFHILLSKLFENELEPSLLLEEEESDTPDNDALLQNLKQEEMSINDLYEKLGTLLKQTPTADLFLFNHKKPLVTELEKYGTPETPRRRGILNQINAYEKALEEGLQHANNAYGIMNSMSEQLEKYLQESIENSNLQKNQCELASLYLQVSNEVDDGIALNLIPKFYKIILRQSKVINIDLQSAEKRSQEDLIKKEARKKTNILNQQKKSASENVVSRRHLPSLKTTRASSLPTIAIPSDNHSIRKTMSNPHVTYDENQKLIFYRTACFQSTLHRNKNILTNAKIIDNLWHWLRFRRLKWDDNFLRHDGQYFNDSARLDDIKSSLTDYKNVNFLRLSQLHFKNLNLLSIQSCLLYSFEGEPTQEDKEAVIKDLKILLIKKEIDFFIGFRGNNNQYQEITINFTDLKSEPPLLFDGEPYRGVKLWQVIDDYIVKNNGLSTTPLVVERKLKYFKEKELLPLLKIMHCDIRLQFQKLKEGYDIAKNNLKKELLANQAHDEANKKICIINEDSCEIHNLTTYFPQQRKNICDDLMTHTHHLMAFQVFVGKKLKKHMGTDELDKNRFLTQVRGQFYKMKNYSLEKGQPMDKRHEDYTSNEEFFGLYSHFFTNQQQPQKKSQDVKEKETTQNVSFHKLPKRSLLLKQAIKEDTKLVEKTLLQI